ncbi:hypothetical protein MKC54_09675 [[Clostridium] innocuum]|nr:hypothetical protein [[Clostridium] innocuum]MCR0577155.1 hypothetical protein [[Clostridium] innocuum]
MISIDKKLLQLSKQREKELGKKSEIEKKIHILDIEIKKYEDYKKQQMKLDQMRIELEKKIAENL